METMRLRKLILATALVIAFHAHAEAPLKKKTVLEARQPALPHAIRTVSSADAPDWNKSRNLFTHPVAVKEMAYAWDNQGCRKYSRLQKLDGPELAPVIGRLRKAFQKGNPRELGKGTYGTVEAGVCQRVSSMKLDKGKKKISNIIVEAEDGVWTAQRQDFRLER